MQVLSGDKDTLVYVRMLSQANQGVMIAINRAPTPAKLQIVLDGTILDRATGANLLLGHRKAQIEGNALKLDVPAYGL